MRRLARVIALFFYYSFVCYLPNYAFPAGRLFNWLRIQCLRNIIAIGTRCRVMRHVYIGDGNGVEIGNDCRINEAVRLDHVKIGNHVMIARECILLGKMHEFKELTIPMEQQGNIECDHIIIDDDVWLGLRVIVMPGVHIKKGCIIGAGAVLTKSTEENGIYAGVPAKLIHKRE